MALIRHINRRPKGRQGETCPSCAGKRFKTDNHTRRTHQLLHKEIRTA